ncbi:MAG: response regulator [Desulfobacterales bacterium]
MHRCDYFSESQKFSELISAWSLFGDRRKEEIGVKAWRGSGTVLIADDEETVCGVGKQMLDRIGFTVLTAPDGRESLKVFREHADEIVCVLLYLTMPSMDGVEAFREMRRLHSGVTVILCSGYNELDATCGLTRQKKSSTGGCLITV